VEGESQMSEPRVGVYVCHCGANIAGVVNVEEVSKYVENLPNVVTAKNYVYMCSQPGQGLIKKDIEELDINRVIVASCSPRMHEPTYQKAIEEAGINPFFFEMANIREHVSWAHINEPERATEKAKDLIRMAIARASLLEPISKMEVNVTEKALVIGAGVAGITAACDLARMGFEVYLVEKEAHVGGHLASLNKLSWDREASEILDSLTQKLSTPKINLLYNSEVAELSGYIGNFKAKIIQKPRYVNGKCDICGKCEEVCPVTQPNRLNSNLDQRKAIYLPLPNCYPPLYLVDKENCTDCGECLKVCENGAINFNDEPVEVDVDVGMVIVTTGFEPYTPDGEFGYGKFKDVITQLTLERILSENGPSNGRLIRPSNGTAPKSTAFIMCVGSRQENGSEQSGSPTNPYCSRYCCSTTLKNALILKERYPESEVYVIYRDIRTFERGNEELYRKCRGSGVTFIRYKQEIPPTVEKTDNDQLTINVKDYLFGVNLEITTDLIVLVEGMVSRAEADEVRGKLSITRSADGFFQEAHAKMNPLNTFAEGIFIGGACQGPKDIEDTVLQASGAAAKAAIFLCQGKVILDLVTATVDEENCTACAKCINVCPYKAIELDESEEHVQVIDVKCKGCGSCSATCPIGAIQVSHFKDEQILAMVETLVPS
jgi:heterodisulfide reductase subunit A